MNEKTKAKRDELADKAFTDQCGLMNSYLKGSDEVTAMGKIANSLGVKKGFKLGFDAGYAEAMEQAKTLVDALEFCAAQVTWVDDKNQDVILTYGYHVEKARNALEQFKKDTE